jgi:crossover junction endodeoxyribonuclease RuvC
MVLGLDPGTNLVGFAFCTGTQKKPKIEDFGVIKTLPKSREEMPFRLLEIAQDLEFLLDKYKPVKAFVEDLFFFKNSKTVISVAQSRGVLLYLLAKKKVEIYSLTPLQVKQSFCGYGRADKKQIQKMVQKVYNLDEIPKPDDAADSLAMAWLALGKKS